MRVGDHQLLIRRIDDEHGEQPRRLGFTGVGAHPMMGAGILEPRLTGPVDAGRLAIDLAADRAREDVGVDESRAGVTVRGRTRPGGVVDDQADQALPGRFGIGLSAATVTVSRRGAPCRGAQRRASLVRVRMCDAKPLPKNRSRCRDGHRSSRFHVNILSSLRELVIRVPAEATGRQRVARRRRAPAVPRRRSVRLCRPR